MNTAMVKPKILRMHADLRREIEECLATGQAFLAIGEAARVLAQLLGGIVEPMASREENGMTEIYRLSAGREDDLFKHMADTFTAECFRVDDITGLPIMCVPLANSERTQFQAFKIAGKPVYGVQFEPSQDFVGRFVATFPQRA